MLALTISRQRSSDCHVVVFDEANAGKTFFENGNKLLYFPASEPLGFWQKVSSRRKHIKQCLRHLREIGGTNITSLTVFNSRREETQACVAYCDRYAINLSQAEDGCQSYVENLRNRQPIHYVLFKKLAFFGYRAISPSFIFHESQRYYVLFPDVIPRRLMNEQIEPISHRSFRETIWSLAPRQENDFCNTVIIVLQNSEIVGDFDQYILSVKTEMDRYSEADKICLKPHPREKREMDIATTFGPELMLSKTCPLEFYAKNFSHTTTLVVPFSTAAFTARILAPKVNLVLGHQRDPVSQECYERLINASVAD